MSRPSPKIRLNSPAPSTPNVSRITSPSPSPLASPGTPSRSASSESTYQRTFRAIVKNISIIDSNWKSLSSQWSATASRIVKQQNALSNPTSVSGDSNTSTSVAKQVRTLESEQIQLFELYDKLTYQLEQMKKNTKMSQQLLLDMSKRKGLDAAFADPLFLTWPLSRLVDELDVFTRWHSLELVELRDSLEKLTSSDPACITEATVTVHEKMSRSTSHTDRQAARRTQACDEFLEICEVEMTPIVHCSAT